MNLESKIESILFVVGRGISVSEIMKVVDVNEKEVINTLDDLKLRYKDEESGLCLITDGFLYKMSTKPENLDVIEKFISVEISSELTKPQLETLTIIGYLGPITKSELEELRGVSCGIILKNLMMRGLVSEKEEDGGLFSLYVLSTDALGYLGISSVEELPDYTKLRDHDNIRNILNKKDEE
ncbi:MAG: SMC-Scp complex subunit ScpB [Candidatus Magasanikbacteria bacterium CG_4_9_14_3_um_filter_32_9]|uniref:SMC-Scp complex subunit ScpB n=1 Tax=Candidatus Magasanikbacteria bacterium CG_4_9_14_3_um_filter_32_9 TaxID=1974644 RepID=A0A2M7Z679_9BACT|nr:MAG: SMC-Scp complex subunit ScpB [Candidatus Magasanikbacteria bacterium CG_4_9_14_3_um_filter_32_9]